MPPPFWLSQPCTIAWLIESSAPAAIRMPPPPKALAPSTMRTASSVDVPLTTLSPRDIPPASIVMSASPSPSVSPSIATLFTISSWPKARAIRPSSMPGVDPPARLGANVMVSASEPALASASASRSDRPPPPGSAAVAAASFSSARVVTMKLGMVASQTGFSGSG
jgi:hypothetical protein